MQVRKAVFPVAGLGTRFLPATKASPKEMLPVVDKPLIQYAVEEAVKAGITELIFVTNSSKRAIEDHFDSNFELETTLKAKNKTEQLNLVKNVSPKGIACVYVRQKQALGLGHAVLCAKEVVGNEPFAVILADDLIRCKAKNCIEQMLNLYQQTGASVIAVEEVDDSTKYGIIDFIKNEKELKQIQSIVEKPSPQDAPSDYGVAGRYVLTPKIFELLEKTPQGVGGEIQLTDAIATLLQYESIYACAFDGYRYDCGDKLGYLRATVEYALAHPKLAAEFRHYLKALTL